MDDQERTLCTLFDNYNVESDPYSANEVEMLHIVAAGRYIVLVVCVADVHCVYELCH